MKLQISTILLILSGFGAFGQSVCEDAKLRAQKDFAEGGYYWLHSAEFKPSQNTYLDILRKDYKVKYSFVDQDSLAKYDCYDATLIDLLKSKYGQDFLREATVKAEELESKNRESDPQFPGGEAAMIQYVMDRLEVDTDDLGGRTKAKIFVRFAITTDGDLEEIRILRGINEEVDERLIQIFENMPQWQPAYRFGSPTRQMYTMPIDIKLN